jgi:hypothetical protein
MLPVVQGPLMWAVQMRLSLQAGFLAYAQISTDGSRVLIIGRLSARIAMNSYRNPG